MEPYKRKKNNTPQQSGINHADSVMFWMLSRRFEHRQTFDLALK
jgi:hypothetical protein